MGSETKGTVELQENSKVVPVDDGACHGSPCWRPSGLFPDPGDCCGFFSCASCRAYRLRCAPGTVFDRQLGLCNHPYAAPACLAPNPGCYLYYLGSPSAGKK
ncbi:endochitinase-like [Haemaphysalis longicornis]